MIARTASHFAAVRETENLTMENTAPQFAADASHLAGIGYPLPPSGARRVAALEFKEHSNLAKESDMALRKP